MIQLEPISHVPRESRRNCFFGLCFGSPGPDKRRHCPPLSLRDCIGWALDRNLRVLIARDSADIARFTLQASQGLYDPVFSLSGRDIFVNVPAQFDAKKIGISAEYEEQLVSFGPGLSGRLPFGST